MGRYVCVHHMGLTENPQYLLQGHFFLDLGYTQIIQIIHLNILNFFLAIKTLCLNTVMLIGSCSWVIAFESIIEHMITIYSLESSCN